MELIRISDRKLKVMLTRAEVEKFQLDPVGASCCSLHASFRLLLSEIEQKSGFDACGKELSIQYFPSREGGCEMFISNLREEAQTAETAKPARQEIAGFRKEYAFRFLEMEALLTACKRLLQTGYCGESQAYLDGSDQCFLLLDLLSSHPFEMPEELLFLSEYGKQESLTETKLYLLEHGRPLCNSNAVARLAEYI